jgi:hypothetical protein
VKTARRGVKLFIFQQINSLEWPQEHADSSNLKRERIYRFSTPISALARVEWENDAAEYKERAPMATFGARATK